MWSETRIMSARCRSASAAMAIGILLAGCGTGAAEEPSEATTSAGDGFPITISTALGETKLDAAPGRVITLADDEFVVALDVVPVAMSKNFSESGISGPVTEALGGAAVGDGRPELLEVSAGWPYEQIASLSPDLIVGGVSQQDYDQLEAIAPTLPYETSSTTEAWQDRQRTIGRALGLTDLAEERIAAAEAEIAAVVDDAPDELNGATFSLAFAFQQGAVSVAIDEKEAAADLLSSVGLSLDPRTAGLPGADQSGRVTINYEMLDVLAADVVLLMGPDPALIDEVRSSPAFVAMMETNPTTVLVVVPFDVAMPLVRPSTLTAAPTLDAIVTLYASAASE